MPIVEMTMIEGYDAQAKQRLVTSLTRAVRSVMAAPPEGVIIVLREVKGGCYARGGAARVPGPPLPTGEEVVKAFLKAVERGDAAAAAALTDEEFVALRPDGTTGGLREYLAHAADSLGRRTYSDFHEAFTDQGSVLTAQGRQAGAPLIETFEIAGGRILRAQQYQ